MRWLGLDYGDKTIGVAISNERVAAGFTTLRRNDSQAIRANLKELKTIVREQSIGAFVLGYPKHMDNSESERCALVLDFKGKLERYFKLPVHLWDERLSTIAAARAFDGKRERFEARIDEMAAVYILQGYLDHKHTEDNMENVENIITMHDEDGNEANFEVLAAQETDGFMYWLLAEMSDDEDEAEVFHYKCVMDDDEEATFELIDDEHPEFEKMLELFKDDYLELEIEID